MCVGNSDYTISQVLYSFPPVHSAMQLKFAIDLVASYWSVGFSCDSNNMALSMNLI